MPLKAEVMPRNRGNRIEEEKETITRTSTSKGSRSKQRLDGIGANPVGGEQDCHTGTLINPSFHHLSYLKRSSFSLLRCSLPNHYMNSLHWVTEEAGDHHSRYLRRTLGKRVTQAHLFLSLGWEKKGRMKWKEQTRSDESQNFPPALTDNFTTS